MDRLSAEHRSWNMSRIRGKNTRPELAVRSLLHRLGFRFRLHQRDLPGKPDIVMPGHRTVILVHGCFWHRHPRCRFAYTPKSRLAFWRRKFDENRARDRKTAAALRRAGWRVIVIWECQAAKAEALDRVLQQRMKGRTLDK